MNYSYAKVYILDAPYQIDIEYTYFLPIELSESAAVGRFVTVPFGNGNKKKRAVIISLENETSSKTTKPILSIADNKFDLDEKMIELCLFIKQYTLCTFGEALRTVVPSGAFAKLEEYYVISKNIPSDVHLSDDCREIIKYLMIVQRAKPDDIYARFGQSSVKLLAKLEKQGFIQSEHEIVGQTNNKFIETLYCTVDEGVYFTLIGDGVQKPLLKSKKQIELLSVIKQNPGIEKNALLEETASSISPLKSLLEKGYVKIEKKELYRDPYLNENKKMPPNVLSSAQNSAFEQLASLYHSDTAKAALLYGVTGSGKTRVIKAMIDEVLASGRKVIMLVPEISLTPQTVSIFCGYYGAKVAVIHSALSEGERFDAWKRIRRGEIDLVIGTRSAVFSPVSNLGMIVIDEEQEHTYKSDSTPKYHARDIARFRCGKENALMLLASATPSIESYYKSKSGTYSLVTLSERYGNAVLPDVKICDMRDELRSGNTSPLSHELVQRIEKVKSSHKQAILLLNRRGYNNFVLCRSCGEVIKCPHCSVSMTFHRTKGGGYLMCHYCGNRKDPPKECPNCKSPHIEYVGCGTQRAETELKLLMPDLTILRMDADTTSTKHSYDRMLNQFRQGDADVLLGTQMIAKGHDFPDVVLVGVLSADTALNLNDYRAGERAFSLLTQVIGRAGRGEAHGTALIQTFSPTNEILSLACTQNYESFYEHEIKLRESYVFPPFCDIAQFSLSASEEVELFTAANNLLQELKNLTKTDYSDVKYIAFGPFEAPIYKLNERYRLRMVLKCRQNKRTRELFSELLKKCGCKLGKKVSVSVDINPSSI